MEVRWQGRGSTSGLALRLMTVVAAILAVFCVVLAVAWSREHEARDCWREAAEFGLEPNACR